MEALELESLQPGHRYEMSDGQERVFRGVGMGGDYTNHFRFDMMPWIPGTGRTQPVKEIHTTAKERGEEFLDKVIRRQMCYGAQVNMGCDPEIFLTRKGRSSLLPAFTVLPKKGQGIETFWDGYQAEFLVSPGGCISGLTGRIKDKLAQVRKRATEKLTGAAFGWDGVEEHVDVGFIPRSVVKIPRLALAAATDEQVELGCDPSVNVYGMSGVKVGNGRELEYRFAGGHVHIGISPLYLTPLIVEQAVRMMDLAAGIPGVIMAEDWDEPIRRKFYGLPGEHRLPQHGLEYRSLSNFWLRSPGIAQLMLGLVRIGFQWGVAGGRDAFSATDQEVIQVMMEGDVKGARDIVAKDAEVWERMLGAAFPGEGTAGRTLRAFTEPHKVLRDPQDTFETWSMFGGYPAEWSWEQLSRLAR